MAAPLPGLLIPIVIVAGEPISVSGTWKVPPLATAAKPPVAGTCPTTTLGAVPVRLNVIAPVVVVPLVAAPPEVTRLNGQKNCAKASAAFAGAYPSVKVTDCRGVSVAAGALPVNAVEPTILPGCENVTTPVPVNVTVTVAEMLCPTTGAFSGIVPPLATFAACPLSCTVIENCAAAGDKPNAATNAPRARRRVVTRSSARKGFSREIRYRGKETAAPAGCPSSR